MKIIFAAFAAVALSACQPVIARLTGAGPGAGQEAGQQTVILPAAALAGRTMRAQIPSRGADAVLMLVAMNGDVETWQAVDNITVSFQRGVLVASRGLGFDLMGADAQGTLDAFAGTGAPVYRRQMRFLTGEHKSTFLMAGCSMRAMGKDTVAAESFARFEENCQARQWTIKNQFWKDGAGNIIRARQWVSPEIGYISTSLRK